MRFRWLASAGLSAVGMFGTGALIVAPSGRLVAQEPQILESFGLSDASAAGTDVVTLSIAPLDRLLPDITHVMRTVGVGAQSGIITQAVNGYTSGVDRDRPIGAFVKLGESGLPMGVVALPIADLDEFLGGLELFGEAEDLGDGLYSMNLGPNTLFAKHQGDWLFVSTAEDALEGAPSDAGGRLAKMSTNNDISFEVNVQNVPDELVDLLVGQMRTGFEQAMEAQSGDLSDEELEASREQGELMMKNVEEAITSTERFAFGLGINPKEKNLTIDFGAQMVEGSRLAKQFGSMRSLKSAIAGFLSDSNMFTAKSMALYGAEDIKQVEASLDQAMTAVNKQIEDQVSNPVAAEKVKDYVGRLVKILADSSKEGSVETALSVTTDPSLNVIAGFTLTDGSKVEALAQDLANEASSAGAPVTVKLMSGKHQGANLHNVTVPLPDNADDNVRKIVGDNVNIAIATAPKAVFLSVGKSAEASLKTALDAAAGNKGLPAVPARVRLSLSQLLNFIQSIESNPVIDGMLSSITSGDDMIMLDSQVIERGGMNRLTIQEGVLKAISGGARAGMPGPGGF
jgi:hypothetical protein